MKKIFLIFTCSVFAFFVGCSKNEPEQTELDALIQCVPADVAFFFGTHYSKRFQKEIIDDAGYQKMLGALEKNPTLNAKLKKLAEHFSKDSKGVSEIFLNAENPMKDIISLLSKAEDFTLVAFADGVEIDGKLNLKSGKKTLPQWTLVASGQYVGAIEKLLVSDEKVEKEIRDGRIFFVPEIPDAKKLKIIVSIDGTTLKAASSIERILAFEASQKNVPAKAIRDVPAFKKLQKGYEKSDTIFFVNFDKIKGFREIKAETEFNKSILKTIEGAGLFCKSYSTVGEVTGCMRITFKESIYALEFLKSAGTRKLETLKNSLPGAEYVIGIALPKITPDVLSAAKMLGAETIDEEKISIAQKLDLQTLTLSLKDNENWMNIKKYSTNDLPQVFAKITCGDVDAILKNKEIEPALNSPIIAKETISDTEVYASMFGIKFAPIGKNIFYAAKTKDSAETLALAKGTGKSLASEKTFASIQKKLGTGNVLELFSNDKKLIAAYKSVTKAVLDESMGKLEDEEVDEAEAVDEESAAEAIAETNPNDWKKRQIHNLKMALKLYDWLDVATKKSLTAMSLRLDDATTLTIPFVSEYEYDFSAIAEKIEAVK